VVVLWGDTRNQWEYHARGEKKSSGGPPEREQRWFGKQIEITELLCDGGDKDSVREEIRRNADTKSEWKKGQIS